MILLSIAKVRLSPTSQSERMALSFFLFANAALAYLPTAHFEALMPLFPIRHIQYVQLFPLKPAPFRKLSDGLGSTNKSVISFLSSSSLTPALSSPFCHLIRLFFYIKLFARFGRNCLPSSCSIRLQWVPGHSFLPGSDVADEQTRRGALLVPPAVPCILSPLISRIHSYLFSD